MVRTIKLDKMKTEQGQERKGNPGITNVIRLIRNPREITSDIIGKYDHIFISTPPYNFKKINKVKRELGFLLSLGKQYSVIVEQTNNGIEYFDCLRIN